MKKPYDLSMFKYLSTVSKDLGPELRDFAWQDGYGAFSVSESAVSNVKRYIMNQDKHHGKKNFKDEVEELFKEHGLDYDENFFWR